MFLFMSVNYAILKFMKSITAFKYSSYFSKSDNSKIMVNYFKILALLYYAFMGLPLVFGNDNSPIYCSPDTSQMNSFLIGSDYTSNTSTFGRFSEISTQPSVSGYITYATKHGLMIGISPVVIKNSDSTATASTYEFDFNLEYQYRLNKYFSITPAYNHYFFSKNSASPKSLYNNQFTLGLNFNSKWVYADLLGYYLKGEYHEWMTTAQMGLNIQFENVFFKNHSISFSPEVNVTFGNQDYYSHLANKIYAFLYVLAKNNSSVTIADLYTNENKYPRIWRYLNNHPKVLKNFEKFDKEMLVSELFKANTQFNLSSIGLNFPLYYSMGNFSLNFTYSVYFPQNAPKYMSSDPVSFFSTGISYIFSL
jgi:hypothetical protein